MRAVGMRDEQQDRCVTGDAPHERDDKHTMGQQDPSSTLWVGEAFNDSLGYPRYCHHGSSNVDPHVQRRCIQPPATGPRRRVRNVAGMTPLFGEHVLRGFWKSWVADNDQ